MAELWRSIVLSQGRNDLTPEYWGYKHLSSDLVVSVSPSRKCRKGEVWGGAPPQRVSVTWECVSRWHSTYQHTHTLHRIQKENQAAISHKVFGLLWPFSLVRWTTLTWLLSSSTSHFLYVVVGLNLRSVWARHALHCWAVFLSFQTHVSEKFCLPV